ncbi:hypothetical protein [Marinococcus halophilus]|uniref:hypothetical protein n=1 Tax=Marinococcus halophilus TaxID=1371 RepID=UPI0015C4E385|nr:hypothetical protein [Marinococcus halophilus]
MIQVFQFGLKALNHVLKGSVKGAWIHGLTRIVSEDQLNIREMLVIIRPGIIQELFDKVFHGGTLVIINGFDIIVLELLQDTLTIARLIIKAHKGPPLLKVIVVGYANV